MQIKKEKQREKQREEETKRKEREKYREWERYRVRKTMTEKDTEWGGKMESEKEYNITSFLVQIKFITEDSKWFIYKY